MDSGKQCRWCIRYWLLISQGHNHTVAIKTNYTLWSWGSGASGQLGLNSSTSYNTPQQVGTDNIWQKVEAGGDHTVTTKNGSTLWTFGRNLNGQLGNASNISRFIPTQITCPNLDIDTFNISSFSIYPNPANDVLNIRNKGNLQIDKVLVYDITGKKILEEAKNVDTIKIQNLQAGLYFLQIESEGKTSKNIFIKQ